LGEHFETVLNLAEEPCVVTADIGSLEQIIMNLVVNARDAMPSGGRLTLKTQRVAFDWKGQRHRELDAGAYVVFTVQDTGSGMTDEVKTRLFEPFFTTKPPGQGAGLGLAMCHGMVKQAGGCISVQSALGSGTTVEVFLPRAKSASPPKEAAKPPVIATEGQETLLVVEDDARILRVALDALTRLGYRVLHASDGQQALALVEGFTEPIQLLITDVVMPKMGGLELASRLTKSRPGLRVLFCSGYTGGAIVDHAEVEFLQKPYAPTALARRVREILDRS
jgi:two-component system, cell cycle sensor histidine kinase and response regulator CckA